MPNSLKTCLVLLGLLLPALLLGLGDRPLYKIQEVRVAETAREMLVSGDWMVPRYNGELRLQKPPLPYWITAASYRVTGVNLRAVRLPAALFGLMGTWLLFAWCRRHLGLAVAANAALILATSFIGLRYFRSGEADAPLLFFVAMACLAGYEVLQGNPQRRMAWAFFVALGLGFITKGPAALAIPALTLLAATWSGRRLGVPKPLLSLGGWAVFLLLGFFWYAWLLWQLPDAAQHFVGKQVDDTFVTGTHAKPFWWYLVHVFDFFAPWSLLLVPAGIWLYRARPLPSPLRFALVWLVVVFLLLMGTVNKQMQYALLLAPPLAVLLGYYAASVKLPLGWRLVIMVALGVACAALPVFGFFQYPEAGASNLVWPAIALLPLLLRYILKVDSVGTVMLLVAGLTVAAFLFIEKHDADPKKTQVRTLMEVAAARYPLYQLKPGDGAVSYYAGRVVPPVTAEDLAALAKHSGTLWVVTTKGQSLAVGERVSESGETALWQVMNP